MKVRAAITLLSIALGLGGTGCGTTSNSPSSSSSSTGFTGASGGSPMLTWTSDGNPLVPLCPVTSTTTNCVSSYTIHDKTTGGMVTVKITYTSYGPVDPTHSYEIRVNGFDGNGTPISSPYAGFSASQ
jgi:hypothetical protein